MAGVLSLMSLELIKGPSCQDLTELLACPICKEIRFPPVYTCTTGHVICHTCLPRISSCGLCKQPINFGSRNFSLEAIILSSVFQCPYKKFGCDNNLIGESYQKHVQSICEYRPYSCFRKTCKSHVMPYNHEIILEHLKCVHEIHIANSDHSVYQAIEGSNELSTGGLIMSSVLRYNGKIFFTNCQTKDSVKYWWLSILDTEDEAKQYKIVLTLYPVKRTKAAMKLEWILPIHSFRSSFSQVLESGYYASISIPNLSNFCASAGEYENMAQVTFKYIWKFRFVFQKEGKKKARKEL